MEGLLRVDPLSNFPQSPSNSFLADEIASTCPLLTPSPPTNALVNPLPENDQTHNNFIYAEDLASKLHQVKEDNVESTESNSSNSSVLAEQLLNHNHYLHIKKDEETVAQETGGKIQPLQMTFRNPPENYFFMKWNWPLIRKVSAWIFLSCMIGMIAIVVGMVWNLPKTCNPPTEWYQGNLMYEIFPASFADSNGDGIGDLKGISLKTDYIHSLGVTTVRLNSIFPSSEYPENYKNVTSLTDIAPQLGDIQDFIILTNTLRVKEMHVILDLPVWPYVRKFGTTASVQISEFNVTDVKVSYEFLKSIDGNEDIISRAMEFWIDHGVDGFYLKGLDRLIEDANFISSLRKWKKILGPERIIIVDHKVIENTPSELINIVANNVDLIDYRLDIEGGVEKIANQIDNVINGTLFSQAHMPWIHWSLGDENTVRLANRLPCSNGTLGATIFQLMLPGTPSLFYGDEIGLRQISDPHHDRTDTRHLHQLAAMVWRRPEKPFGYKHILPWMHGEPTPTNFDQLHIVSQMTRLRSTSPAIYVNSVRKDGNNKANAEVKYSENDLLVIQRWYPRRKSYVVVCNLGDTYVAADLSTILYSGEVVVGPRAFSKPESISFKDISLWPGESVVILLH